MKDIPSFPEKVVFIDLYRYSMTQFSKSLLWIYFNNFSIESVPIVEDYPIGKYFHFDLCIWKMLFQNLPEVLSFSFLSIFRTNDSVYFQV